jgi:hypothetical protein
VEHKEKPLTDSEIAALRAAYTQQEHWKWLRRLLKSVGLWIAGLVTGAWAALDALAKALDWWRKL